jgi:prepilin-type processing-associated H-X9-DG protein
MQKAVFRRDRISAFTRLDLLAVVAMLFLFSFLAAPALSIGKTQSDVIECFANNRKLAQAWMSYTIDNGDIMPGTVLGDSSKPFQGPGADTTLAQYRPWCIGVLSWDTNSSNTNLLLVADPNYSTLADYLKRDKSVFRCPADVFLSPVQKSLRWQNRIRSTSMNAYVGSGFYDFLFDPYLVQVSRISNLRNPEPRNTFVFIEEHPDSINDGAFIPPRRTGSGTYDVIDLPANYHEGGATMTFADGHVELKKWATPLRSTPVRYQFPFLAPSAYTADLAFLYFHTPQRQ